jgi:outer membrane receptor for ferrienterochelin and colicin
LLDARLINETDFNWNWGNRTTSLKWRHVPNSKFFSETTLSATNYGFNLDLIISKTDSLAGTASNRIRVLNNIADLTLENKSTCYLSRRHTATVGFTLKKLAMDFNQKIDAVTYFDLRQSPLIASAFIQDKWQISALLALQFGWRTTRYELHDRLYYEPASGLNIT